MNALIVAMVVAAGTDQNNNIITLKLSSNIDATASEQFFIAENNESIEAIKALNELIASIPGTTIHPLVDHKNRKRERELRRRLEDNTKTPLPKLEQWFYLKAVSSQQATIILKKIQSSSAVEQADIQPQSSAPAAVDIAPTTPLLGIPSYLGPLGIDQFIDSGPSGVNGEFCSIYDIERDYRADHEDIDYVGWHPLIGLTSGIAGDVEHGNMVFGVIRGENNSYGFRGVTTSARVGLAVPLFGTGVAAAITAARDELLTNGRAIKIVLIEQQFECTPMPGITSCVGTLPDGGVDNPQCGCLPVESHQIEFDAIRNAVAAGIIVVEAAGNGSANLDHPSFSSTLARDSGAFLIGNGSSTGAASPNSNFGSRVRFNARGGETTGCPIGLPGCFFPGVSIDNRQKYTNNFGGTSAASAILASTICAVQGYALSSRGTSLSNSDLQARLIASSIQTAPSTVGVRPSIRRAVKSLGRADVMAVDGNFGSWFVVPSDGSGFSGSYTTLTSWAAGWSGWTRLVGDFNGDGTTDIIAKENNATSRWYVATGGPSSFTPNVPWLSGWAPGTGYAVAAGDWNGDGATDLLAVELTSPHRWYTAIASGTTFVPQAFSISSDVNGLQLLVGDVNKDGRDDVILKNSAGTWTVAKSTGLGFLSPSTFLTGWAPGPYFVSVGDFNGDGVADLYAKAPTGSDHYVATSIGTSFVPQPAWLTSWAAGSNWAVLTGDFTGEGLSDVTVKDLSAPGDWHVSTSTGTSFLPQPVWLNGGWGLGNYQLFTGNFDGK